MKRNAVLLVLTATLYHCEQIDQPSYSLCQLVLAISFCRSVCILFFALHCHEVLPYARFIIWLTAVSPKELSVQWVILVKMKQILDEQWKILCLPLHLGSLLCIGYEAYDRTTVGSSFTGWLTLVYILDHSDKYIADRKGDRATIR